MPSAPMPAHDATDKNLPPESNPDSPAGSVAEVGGPPQRTRWSVANISILLVTAATLAFLALRLGPALLGFKTFGAFDLLSNLAPWNNGDPLVRPTNGTMTDAVDAALPVYLQIRDRLFLGDLALWSSVAGPGTGLLSSPATPVLTPTGIWFLIFPTVYATGFAKLAEVVIAILGMMFWLRRVGAAVQAGLLAGLLYCGTGFFTGWSTWTAQAGIAAMIPALFWAIERFIQLRTARSAVPVALMVGFLLLGGFPAAAGHALYAGGSYFLVRLIADRRNHPLRHNLSILLGGIGALMIGVLLSAVQFIPQLAGLADSDLSYRSGQFYVELPGRSLFTTIFPETFFAAGYGGLNAIEAYAYLGITTLTLAAVAVFTHRRGEFSAGVVLYLAVGASFAVSLLWFQGFWTDWLAEFPIFTGNLTTRIRDVLAVFACGLAGLGAHQVFAAIRNNKLRLAGAAVAAACAAVVAALTFAVQWRYSEITDGATLVTDAGLGLIAILAIGVACLVARLKWVKVATFAIVCVIAAIQVSISVSNYWPLSDNGDVYPDLPITTALATTTGEDRVLSLGSTLRGSTPAIYGIRSVIGHVFYPAEWTDMIQRLDPKAFGAPSGSKTNPVVNTRIPFDAEQDALLDRMSVATFLTTPGQPIPGPTQQLSGLPEATGSSAVTATLTINTTVTASTPVAPQSLRAVFIEVAQTVGGSPTDGVTITAEILAGDGSSLAEGMVTRPEIPAGTLQIPIAGETLDQAQGPLKLQISADHPVLLGAYADGSLAARITGSADDGLALMFADDHGAVWARSTVMPRIRWADAAQVIPDPVARLNRLADPSLPGDVVLLSSIDGDTIGSQPPENLEAIDPVLTTTQDSGDQIDVSVQTASDGYLVVADWMQTNWTVSVDGRTATLLDADYGFSGVRIPAGNHSVSFVYSNKSMALGAALSAFALLALLLILWWPGMRRTAKRIADRGSLRS